MTTAKPFLMPLLALLAVLACANPRHTPSGGHTLTGAKSFLSGYPAIVGERVIVVVEIPAGTNAKWEVDKSDGAMRWEIQNGEPRVVDYLAYPANYGMVPRTLLPEKLAGDGDPLDVILIGPAQPRGTVIAARLLGILKLDDRGERDDKLIALLEDGPMGGVRSLAELDERYPGVTDILETFMIGYKGPGTIVSRGFGGAAEAERVLRTAMQAFDAQTVPNHDLGRVVDQ